MKKLFTTLMVMCFALASWGQGQEESHITITWSSPTLRMVVSQGLKKKEVDDLKNSNPEWKNNVQKLVITGDFTNNELKDLNELIEICGSNLDVDMSGCTGLYCKYLGFSEVGGESGTESDNVFTTFKVEYPNMHNVTKQVELKELFLYKGKVYTGEVEEDENHRYYIQTWTHSCPQGQDYMWNDFVGGGYTGSKADGSPIGVNGSWSEDGLTYTCYQWYYGPEEGQHSNPCVFSKVVDYVTKGTVWVYEERKPGQEVEYVIVAESDVRNIQDADLTTTEIYEVGSTGTYTFKDGGDKFTLGNAKSHIKSFVFPDNENFTFVPANDVLTSQTSLESVTLSDKIKALDIAAFQNCTGLTTINFPASLEQIGGDCFNGCKALTNGNLSATQLDRIRFHTFNDCEAITEFKFPEETLVTIQTQAFQRCKGFTDLNLKGCHNLRLIGQKAFGECTSLENIYLCSDEKVIKGGTGAGAFYNSKNIKLVEISYCTGTDVVQCKCEFNAFDYDVTNAQTRPADIPNCAKLVFPRDATASAPFIDSFDFFQGYYKTGAVIRQSNLLKYWRNVCSDGISAQGQGQAPDNYDEEASGVPASELGRYINNGWLEFINTGDFTIIQPKNGHFIRTYSRTENSGPVILPYGDDGIHAFRILDFRSTGSLTNDDGDLIYDDEGNEITIAGYILLKELIADVEFEIPDMDEETGEQKVDEQGKPLTKTVTLKRSYVPENTGVVLHSKKIDELAGMVFAPYDGKTNLTEYPNTGSKAYTADYTDISTVETDVNMLMGSFGNKKKIAPTDPWSWGDYGPSGQGGYGSVRTFRNFGLVTNSNGTGTWKRAKPGEIRENRAYAHLPVGRFNNENEDSSVTDLNGGVNFANEDDGSSQSICICMIFEGDDATGIFTIEGNGKVADDDAWYTPQGVRVAVPGKGIYIHNNKKVIFK